MGKNLIFLGAPGAGKGTFAGLLTNKIDLVHISTGDIFRRAIKNGTELGKKAQNYVETGKLVPDELVADMVVKRLTEPDCEKGFILDGFPRTLKQADLLETAFAKNEKEVSRVVFFDAGEDVLIKRLTARLTCRNCGINFNKIYGPPAQEGICDSCGGELYQREDDTIDTAKDRLDVYKTETEPLVEYYKNRGLLYTICAERTKAVMLEELLQEFNSRV